MAAAARIKGMMIAQRIYQGMWGRTDRRGAEILNFRRNLRIR